MGGAVGAFKGSYFKSPEFFMARRFICRIKHIFFLPRLARFRGSVKPVLKAPFFPTNTDACKTICDHGMLIERPLSSRPGF